MNIVIIGTGYVGLVTGTCFSEMGNNVICVDNDMDKIKDLQRGIIPIYEPGLQELVSSNIQKENLFFTTQIHQAVNDSDVCFIAVGTPMGENGEADLQYVLAVAQSIGKYMEHHMYVVVKSTVPVGTCELVRLKIQEELNKRECNLTFEIISNPEFLKEGSACEDFLKPDRVVIGADSINAVEVMRDLYAPFLISNELFIVMDIKSAELTKYAANAMLATKISFINEIANICEKVGADINKIRMGIGSDKRIGYSFIYPGCGYGGSCFPKDVQALIKTSGNFGYEAQLLKSVESVNIRQKHLLVDKIVNVFGEDLRNKVFAIWGLAFKPGTDDMREAPSIVIIEELTKRGAMVRVYDPKAIEVAKTYYLNHITNIKYVESKYNALNDADALVLITEWKEFRSLDFFEIKKRLKGRKIFDGRNQYKEKTLNSIGLEYYQIGVKKD